MTLERGVVGLPHKESPIIHKRDQRVNAYMARYNRLSQGEIREEIARFTRKSSELPIAERNFAQEVTESIHSSTKITPSERVIEAYEASLEARREAEDAFVALLYDLQTPLRGRDMHIIPSDLPRLLNTLEDTRMKRPQKYPMDGIMPNARDQAVLFLTQVYFYDKQQGEEKRTIIIEGESRDGIEIQKLVYKLNAFLPENDRFVIVHRPQKYPVQTGKGRVIDFEEEAPALLSSSGRKQEKKDTTVPIRTVKKEPTLTAAEKRRKEELEDVLRWSRRRLTFVVSDPNNPIRLDIAPLPKGAMGEVFGREGREHIILFSLLSSVSPEAKKTVVDWLMSEKSATKRRDNVEKLAQLSSDLFHEVLSPETKGVFDRAFAEDVLKEDASMTRLHEAIIAKLFEKTGRRSDQLHDVEKLVITSCERLFLLRHAQILSGEVNREVKERRKALVGGDLIDAEGTTSPKDIEEMLKKIQDEIEFPIDQNAPIMPYELNVRFGTTQIANVAQMLARHINGEPVERELFEEKNDALFEYIVSLCIERWSHQARHLSYMRERMPVSEVEKLGHILPYELTETTDDEGKEHLEQTYYIHDNTPTQTDPHKGLLYIDSETEISVPVTFIPAQKQGENMHIEYVYGINAWIRGMKQRRLILDFIKN